MTPNPEKGTYYDHPPSPPIVGLLTLRCEFDPGKRDFLTKKKKEYPTSGERLLHKIRLHGRRGKGMAESLSRENKARTAEGRWTKNPL